jgi:DNA replication and repair protein RecF
LASWAELAALLPVQIIDPEVHHLIEEGPGRRRRFLDWGVFHVEHGFIAAWQRFQQILKQRNAALRTRQSRGLVSAWDIDFIRLGEAIHQSRSAYVEKLMLAAAPIARNLLDADIGLNYRSGWAKELSLEEALAKAWVHDQESGATSVGPQRAEIAFKLDGESVKDRVSRGQQKLLAASLLLAQLTLFPREEGVIPTLLLDDPAAELDGERLRTLIREISNQPLQLVVTSLADECPGFGSPGRHYRLHDGFVSDV